jgi:hypothetical protein
MYQSISYVLWLYGERERRTAIADGLAVVIWTKRLTTTPDMAKQCLSGQTVTIVI